MKRKVLFITSIRSDFYIQKSFIDAVKKHKKLKELVIVSGAHLSKKFGYTYDEVKKNDYNIISKINNLIISDKLEARVGGLSNQLQKLIKIVIKYQPNFIVSPYDREESLTMAIVGIYLNIPIVHLGAGEKTSVNVDGIVRHSVSKLSHIFFTSSEENKKRLIKLGEEEWRIFNVGHTSKERFLATKSIKLNSLNKILETKIMEKYIILIQHPVSNWFEKTKNHILTTLEAVDKINMQTFIILSNSDPGSQIITREVKNFRFKKNKNVKYFNNLKEDIFVNLFKNASIILGNSSAGILEAHHFKIPVVNIGLRQTDRQNYGNILFVKHSVSSIIKGIKKSLYDKDYIKKINKIKDPNAKLNPGKKMASILARINISNKLINKIITY
tara:strand:- start:490 stop:1647 length:1158 start_codon:yes stop_codon:yes gene_type:complete